MRQYAPSFAVAVAAVLLAVMISVSVQRKSADDQRKAQELAALVSSQAFWLRYDADIAACGRGDILRTVIHDFLAAAEKARRSPPLEPGDLEAAASYAEYDSRIWPLQKCTDLIPAPDVPRPPTLPKE